MQYSPKLKRVMDEIKAILVKEDIAGAIVLHTPGFTEYLVHIEPSYSCAKWVGEAVQVKGKAEHYGGDTEKRDKAVADTANMIHHFAAIPGKISLAMMDLEDHMTNKFGPFDHYGGGLTGPSEQNN